MDEDLAARIANFLESCSSLLDHTVWMVKHHGTEEAFQAHRDAVARVRNALGSELLSPIYEQYPHLDPSSPAFRDGGLTKPPEDPVTDKVVAGHMARLLQQSSGMLVHLVWLAKHYYPEEKFQTYTRAVGRVMGELGFELLYGIYDKYPDLEPVLPPDWKSRGKQTAAAANPSGEAPSKPEEPKGDS